MSVAGTGVEASTLDLSKCSFVPGGEQLLVSSGRWAYCPDAGDPSVTAEVETNNYILKRVDYIVADDTTSPLSAINSTI